MTEAESVTVTPNQANVQTAVIYARVSTDNTDQTVENQIPICQEYCDRHGYKVVGVYSEEHTGSTLNRPKFLEMLGRLELRDVNYVVTYDQSRLTRCKETWGSFDKVKELINSKGALICFASSDIDPQSEAGEIVTTINNLTNAKYNADLSRKTTFAMRRRRDEDGKHMGHPAAFMFEGDIATAPEGRYQEPDLKNGIIGTRTAPEAYIMSLAREGVSLRQTAKYLGISVNTLICEMKPREPVPSRRLKKVAKAKAKDPSYQIKDTDYVYYYRYKGTKDRYSEYMALYEQATGVRKGVCSERPENDDEKCSERVVE